MIIGIPTLNRYDLLHQLIGDLVAQTKLKIVVIDNGGYYEDTRVEVIKNNRRLSLTECWNFFHTLDDELILLNDDLRLPPTAIERLANDPRPFVSICSGDNLWSGFLHRKEIWNTVGEYDPQFPSYFNDSDYRIRMKLKGYEPSTIDVGAAHVKEGTRGRFHDLEKTYFYQQMRLWRCLFLQKWGTLPNCIQFAWETPYKFSKMEQDLGGKTVEYHYLRGARRRMELLPDHSIGWGIRENEQFWAVWDDDFILFNDYYPTIRLHRINDKEWRGRGIQDKRIIANIRIL
jgi:GT2 family glycosyltransferase